MRRGNLSTKEQKIAASAVARLGRCGISITEGPEEWAVHPEKIAEVLQTHSCCIPNAMTGWNETVPLPSSWGSWWANRMIHAMLQCECGTGGKTSQQTVK